MENTVKKFGNVKIKKQKFYQYKRSISIDNIDISKIVSFDKKDLNILSATNILKKLDHNSNVFQK